MCEGDEGDESDEGDEGDESDEGDKCDEGDEGDEEARVAEVVDDCLCRATTYCLCRGPAANPMLHFWRKSINADIYSCLRRGQFGEFV